MDIWILTDNPNSWIVKFIPQLIAQLSNNHSVKHVFTLDELGRGDILCALSCERIIRQEHLNRFKSTIVAHPSPLPKGKGWSPIAWQILEGKNKIPVSLIEAANKMDSGVIYYQEFMRLGPNDLNDEIKMEQFRVTAELVVKYCDNFPVEGMEQSGEESFYPKFTKEDNRLDIKKSIEDQFSLFRIADNERYPCWFEMDGQEFEIKIFKR